MSRPVRPRRAVASFDSASAMLRALARFLHGQDFPLLGALPPKAEQPVRALVTVLERMPAKVREQAFMFSGGSEALPQRRLRDIDAGQLAAWITAQYPDRRYPAVLIGSSNGAATYLAALLGCPWLPQTLFIPVRVRGVHPDEPADALAATRQAAAELLAANPDLALHQMHDPNQDRLMIRRMAYFRVKRLRLASAYERFIRRSLLPDGVIVLVECRTCWPTAPAGERHLFQHGAVGGALPEEYYEGGPRVVAFLERQRSHRRRWEPPPPTGEHPEAEWGFAPALGEDVERFAYARGVKVRRLVFDQPEQLSALVADLYRWWYTRCGLPTNRLLVSSFIHLEPWWAQRTASVPLWAVFNSEPSCAAVHRYLDTVPVYDEIRMTLFSHGVESIGLATIDRWRTVLGRARKVGSFAGVDEAAYPRDFASAVRYHGDLAKIRAYPLPPPVPLAEFEAFLKESAGRYPVGWE